MMEFISLFIFLLLLFRNITSTVYIFGYKNLKTVFTVPQPWIDLFERDVFISILSMKVRDAGNFKWARLSLMKYCSAQQKKKAFKMTEGYTHVIKFPQFPTFPHPSHSIHWQVPLALKSPNLSWIWVHLTISSVRTHSKKPSPHPFFGSLFLYSCSKQSFFDPAARVTL